MFHLANYSLILFTNSQWSSQYLISPIRAHALPWSEHSPSFIEIWACGDKRPLDHIHYKFEHSDMNSRSAQNMELTDSDTSIQCSSFHILLPWSWLITFLRSTVVRIQCKVEASIVYQVHLTTHKGHVMFTWVRSTFFTGKELRFTCWRFVIDYLHKSFDNRCNQALAFRWVVMG